MLRGIDLRFDSTHHHKVDAEGGTIHVFSRWCCSCSRALCLWQPPAGAAAAFDIPSLAKLLALVSPFISRLRLQEVRLLQLGLLRQPPEAAAVAVALAEEHAAAAMTPELQTLRRFASNADPFSKL